MKKRAIVAVLCLVQLGLAEQTWLSKPWPNWSEEEVRQILSNSPWAREVSVDPAQPAAAKVWYRVQIQSATTIRQAIARQTQIGHGIEPGDKNPVVDAYIKSFLAKKFPDTIVADVTFRSDAPERTKELLKYWQEQNVEKLRSSVFLNVGGKKYPLKEFAPTQHQEFGFVFPRPKSVPDGGSMFIEFPHPDAKTRVRAEFKLSEMKVDGAPQL